MQVEWDAAKAAANAAKHRVSFDEAASVFLDPLAASVADPDHSTTEPRYVTFGMSKLGRVLVMAHTWRAGRVRIISARRADRSERKLYEEG